MYHASYGAGQTSTLLPKRSLRKLQIWVRKAQGRLKVLTTAELVGKGAEKNMIDPVEGKPNQLKSDWYVLRNAGQSDFQKPMDVCQATGRSFFQEAFEMGSRERRSASSSYEFNYGKFWRTTYVRSSPGQNHLLVKRLQTAVLGRQVKIETFNVFLAKTPTQAWRLLWCTGPTSLCCPHDLPFQWCSALIAYEG